jgi:hypothetical protein
MKKRRMPKKINKKVTRFNRRLNVNIGMIIFMFIFVYIVAILFLHTSNKEIKSYEVQEGRLYANKEYNGFIIRDEEIIPAEYTGNITYYVREKKKVPVGSTIYAIDETGKMTEFLSLHMNNENALSTEELSGLKQRLSSFSTSFSNMNFDTAYETKYVFETVMLDFVNQAMLDGLDEALSQEGIVFRQINAAKSGIIMFSYDNMENITVENITSDVFNKDNYNKSIMHSGNLIQSGTPAYKIINSENWNVIFQVTEEDVNEYQSLSHLTVTFSDTNLEVNTPFSIFTGADGKQYVKLELSKYMIQFAGDRYVNLRISRRVANGLKIPLSSVATKLFHSVPAKFLIQNEGTGGYEIWKKVYTETGEESIEKIPVTIYYRESSGNLDTENFSEEEILMDDICYISSERIPTGTIALARDSGEEYIIAATALLQGAYNINKGYTIFKQIEILDQNDEYCIIAKNTAFGLTVYDRIVLDSTVVAENELLH